MEVFKPFVLTKQAKQAFEAWHVMLEKGDNISVLFFPYGDKVKRIEQFTKDTTKRPKNKYQRIYIPINPEFVVIEEKEDVLDFITEELIKKNVISKKEHFDTIMATLAKKHVQIVLVIVGAEVLLMPKNHAAY